jgi:predicted ATPase with chaperone activity
LLDRIDIHIDVSRVDYEKLSNDRVGKPSASIRQRVQAARERQRKRFSKNGALVPCAKICGSANDDGILGQGIETAHSCLAAISS